MLKTLEALLLIVFFAAPTGIGPMTDRDAYEWTYRLAPEFSSEAPSLNYTIPYPVPRPNPVFGEITVLVIAVEFKDYNHTLSVEQVTDQTVKPLNDYYSRISYGAVSVVGDAVGWVRLPYVKSSYGMDNGPFVDDQDGDGYPDTWRMLRDAIPIISKQIDVTPYQQILVFHAGFGQESSRDPNDIWSVAYIRWTVNTAQRVFEQFAIVPEFEARGLATVGVNTHEFGHLLGLPDLYSSTVEQVGPWDLMARGAWNGKPAGSSPAEMIAWDRLFLGWIAPERVQNVTAQARMNLTLGPIELASSQLQAIRVQPSSRDTKHYYLVEVRQQIGYDVALPSTGVLITYIDETKSNPVKVIDAVQTTSTLNDAPFQVGQKYADAQNNVIISVSGTDGSSFFVTVDTTTPRPHIVIQSFTINPSTVHPNETVSLNLDITNEGTLKSKAFLVNIYLNETIFLSRRISLKPGQVEQIRASWTPTNSGVYVFKAEVDPEHLVTETSTNNIQSLTLIVGLSLTLEIRPPGAGGDIQWWLIVNNVNQTYSGVGQFQIGLLPGENSLQIQSLIYLNPSSRYVFRQWGDGTAANPRTLNADRDIRLSVDFTPQYLLSLEPNGGVTTPGGWYDNTTSVTVSATSPSNIIEKQSRSAFVNWSGDIQSNSTTITVNMTRPYHIIANWKTQYYLYVQSLYAVSGDGWYDANSPATISLGLPVVIVNGTRHQFLQWTGDVSGTNPNQLIIMSGPTYVSALWSTEYELRIESEYGHTQGAGWYVPSAPAIFMVDAPVIEIANGTRRVFTAWSGDFQGTALSGSIAMDAPKLVRANWGTQYLVTLDTRGVRNGTALTMTVNGQPHQIKVPENVTLWLNAGSSISFSANETATQGFRRFLFVEWRNSTGGPVKSPQSILQPESYTAAYKELSMFPCIIATVTFGSELSPEVQFLRNFRNRLVLSTRAGSAFMSVFNLWYYSFSPQVADFIVLHDTVTSPLRIGLYPLIGILEFSYHAHNVLAFSPEFGIIATGIVASALIGLVYLGPVSLAIARLTATRRTRFTSVLRTLSISFLLALVILGLGELTGSFELLAASTSALVLTALMSAPVLFSFALVRIAHGLRFLTLPRR